MSKFTYTATAPDGVTTGTRTSERDYPFAVAVLIGGMPERTVQRAKLVAPGDPIPAGAVPDKERSAEFPNERIYVRWTEVAPAFAASWRIASFHGTRAAAEKASPGDDRAVRKVVVPTARVAKGRA